MIELIIKLVENIKTLTDITVFGYKSTNVKLPESDKTIYNIYCLFTNNFNMQKINEMIRETVRELRELDEKNVDLVEVSVCFCSKSFFEKFGDDAAKK